jgi:putative flippase GtrA
MQANIIAHHFAVTWHQSWTFEEKKKNSIDYGT